MENPYTPPSSPPEIHRVAPPSLLRVLVGFASGFVLPMVFIYLSVYLFFASSGTEIRFGTEDLPHARGVALLLLNGILCAGIAAYFRAVPIMFIAFSGLALPIGILCFLAVSLWLGLLA